MGGSFHRTWVDLSSSLNVYQAGYSLDVASIGSCFTRHPKTWCRSSMTLSPGALPKTGRPWPSKRIPKGGLIIGLVFTGKIDKTLGLSGEQKKPVKTNPSNDPAKWGVRIFRFCCGKSGPWARVATHVKKKVKPRTHMFSLIWLALISVLLI